MLLKNRTFERQLPNKSAKSFYIFCEGKRREFYYFNYFKEIDSKINVEVYQLTGVEDNSPIGLYNIACNCILKTDDNPTPKYEFIDDLDEVWFVLDCDSYNNHHRLGQIIELVELNKNHKHWFVAQSNPCFEVWLYYHINGNFPKFKNMNVSQQWKTFLSKELPGGFNSMRHTGLLRDAIANAKNNYTDSAGHPDIGCTQVFHLGEKIYELTKEKVAELLKSSIILP